MKWKNYLSDEMFERLCECKNKKSDILPMAKILIKEKNYYPEDALEYVLTWIGDWNGQFNITDLTIDEYNKFIKELKNFKKVIDK